MRRAVLVLVAFLLLPGICTAEPDGYRLIEAAAASVNGEVIFLSDVTREVCFSRCGLYPGAGPAEMTFSQARDRLIAELLVLQDQRKLGLGLVDNAVLDDAFAKASAKKTECSSPCAAALSETEIRDFLRRRLLVRDFLEKRVAVFVEVNDEELKQEIESRKRAGAATGEMNEDTVRKELLEQKRAAGVKSWFARATSKSRIVLSPVAGP